MLVFNYRIRFARGSNVNLAKDYIYTVRAINWIIPVPI